MKVLLICLILAVRCKAEEDLNDTITTTVEKPKFEIKLIDELESPSEIQENYTVVTPIENKTETSGKNVKKKLVKVKKLKKIVKTAVLNDASSYKVHEENNDLKKEEAEFGSKFPQTLLPSNISTYLLGATTNNQGKNSETQTEASQFTTDQQNTSRNNYRPPDRVFGQWNKQKFKLEEAKFQNPYKIYDSHSEETRTAQQTPKKSNTVKFAYKLETYPQESRTVSKHEKPTKKHRRGGKPSLPEIQNVIQTLDNDDNNNNAYNSPKQNHIVEVTQVPLVYEHHYEGGHTDPQTKLVTHQYSYNPPADHTDEAYQLGKILSKNVVQKLQSSQRPLQEYIDGHQEVVLRRPYLKPIGYSQQNFVRTPIRNTIHHPSYLHPLMKYLQPEVTHENFAQDIQQFKTYKFHPQHLVVPKTVMQPVVVEEEPTKSEYETTYLQALSRPQFENHYKEQSSGHEYRQNSPYTTKVQQQFVEVPKYTMVSYLNLQDNIKPQAIHEVEPPNLSELKKYRNLHFVKSHETDWPTSHTEVIKHNEQQSLVPSLHKEQYISQGYQPGTYGSKLKFENIITNQGLVQYVAQSQSPTPQIHHHPRIQMIPSRPYWRKPQVMKLVRVPHYQHNIPKYQQHQIEEPMLETYSDGTPVIYQNIEAQYSSPNIKVVQSNEAQTNSENSAEYSNNALNNFQQQDLELVVAPENSGSPVQVQGIYTLDEKKPAEKPQEIYYIQENQESPAKEELKQYQDTKENQLTNSEGTRQKEIATEVEVIKSISPQYIEMPVNQGNIPQTISYIKPQLGIEEGPHQIIEMPKTYLRYRGQRSRLRSPVMNRPETMRHVMPLVRPRIREMNDDFKGKFIYPKLRSLVSDLMGKQSSRDVDFVVFMKENRELE